MDDTTTVQCLMAAAHFSPSATEMEQLTAAYPAVAGMVAALYAVESARYEVPALHFNPDPIFVDWA
jgi:hypothetical protein